MGTTLDTSGREGFVTEVVEGLEEQKEERRCAVGSTREKGVLSQRSESCLWAGAQESALTDELGAILPQFSRNPETSAPLMLLEPVMCVQLPAVLHSCSLLLQT